MPANTINGIRLFWERTGDAGEPLVLVHSPWVELLEAGNREGEARQFMSNYCLRSRCLGSIAVGITEHSQLQRADLSR